MMERTIKKRSLQEAGSARDELSYWLGKSPEERVAAVDALRRQYYGSAERLQRVARVIQREPR